MRRIPQSLVLIGIAVVAPVWAISLPVTLPAEPLPENGAATVLAPAYAADSWTTGSTSLVPIMAAEMEAKHIAAVDAPADNSDGAVRKPVSDIGFVKQATEIGRKELSSASEALQQLKHPELKHIAEMLVMEHSGANARLSKIAEAKGWPVPGPQPSSPPPTGTASGDFDAVWTAEMIAGHERSIALYRAQAEGGEDTDLRKYAHDTLPSIQRHLAELRRLQK